ncbi:MAG: alpha/beta fold hydrolase [Actinomycetota bacterium]
MVVLIHGSLDRMAGMALLAREIAPVAHVLRFDRRGYGDSWMHPGPYTATANARDVEMLLAGRRALLIGHSFGGNVALAAAEMLGDQILGVSTYETPLSWLPIWPAGTAGGRAVTAGPETAAEEFMVALIGRDKWDRLPGRTREARRREGRALVGELGDLRVSAPWDAGRIACRVLAGHGTEAREHHVRGAQWIVDNVPGAELVVLEGAGHGAPTSHPAQFSAALVMPHLAALKNR